MADVTDPQLFANEDEFRAWLHENHAAEKEIWVILARKGSSLTALDYDAALEVVLAYGWIDGVKRSRDAESSLQRYSPRRAKSPWSARNVRIAERLIAEGAMAPPGLAEIERAKADGRWERAYDGPRNAQPHPDFVAALAENPEAAAFYETLSSQNRFAIYYRIHEAQREETRARRIAKFVDMLARGEKLY